MSSAFAADQRGRRRPGGGGRGPRPPTTSPPGWSAGKDATLWGPDAEGEAAVRLGWLDLPRQLRQLLARARPSCGPSRAEGLDHVVLAGMGGSSLAPEVICRTAGVALTVLDTTDPRQVARRAWPTAGPHASWWCRASRGGTVETDSHRRASTSRPSRAPGSTPADAVRGRHRPGLAAGGRPPRGGLPGRSWPTRTWAAATAPCRRSAWCPRAGGRRHRPAARRGAEALAEPRADTTATRRSSSAPRWAARRWPAATSSSWPTPAPGITGFGDWAEQLIAESTGKDGRGILPVVVEAPDAPGAPADDVLLASWATRPGRPTEPAVGRRTRPARRAVPGLGVRDRDRRPAAGDQPVRPAERAETKESTQAICSRPRGPPDEAARCSPTAPSSSTRRRRPARRRRHGLAGALDAVLAADPGARLSGGDGLSGPGAGRRGAGGCAAAAGRADRAAGHLRLGPPVPALHRPVPQGRPADRRRSCRSPAWWRRISTCPTSPTASASSRPPRPPATGGRSPTATARCCTST